MKLTHDGDEILIDVSWPNTDQAMAIALMADVTLAEFGSRAEDATRMLLRRISTVMADAGRPMLTVREVTQVIEQLPRTT
jgi:hypothetical protein